MHRATRATHTPVGRFFEAGCFWPTVGKVVCALLEAFISERGVLSAGVGTDTILYGKHIAD